MTPKFHLRQIEEGDHSFVYNSWFHTMRSRYEFTDNKLLTSVLSEHAKKALSYGGFVACDPEDETHIYSLLLWHEITPTMAAIDFGYTKQVFRRTGLQRTLLNGLRRYPTRVITMQAPAFTSNEFKSTNGERLGHVLKHKYELTIDPFFYERLSLIGHEV